MILKIYELDGNFHPDENQRTIFEHFADDSLWLNQKGLEKMTVVAEAHGWKVKIIPV